MFPRCSIQGLEEHTSIMPHAAYHSPSPTLRTGLTLIELLISVAIIAALAAALGALASAVQQGSEYSNGYGLTTQHARVALDRIHSQAAEAQTSPLFPGMLVVDTTVSGWRFPDTLVLWLPTGVPVDPEGLPRINELTVILPNPASSNELLELRNPTLTTAVPVTSDTAAWQSLVATLLASNTSETVLLTDLVRGASASNIPRRACVRFEIEMNPSEAEWTSFQAGGLPWAEIAFAQDIRGTQTGLRQVWLRSEIQLTPPAASANPSQTLSAAPYFGSTGLMYELSK
jgi:prepilin-type N-terminal cleavage/methylation domain-containing protein